MKVTIAIVVNEDGEWYAWGQDGCTKDAMRNEVEGNVNEPYVVHFIEVEVPLPAPQTFQGNICSTPSTTQS